MIAYLPEYPVQQIEVPDSAITYQNDGLVQFNITDHANRSVTSQQAFKTKLLAALRYQVDLGYRLQDLANLCSKANQQVCQLQGQPSEALPTN